jgi:hypothetical protein
MISILTSLLLFYRQVHQSIFARVSQDLFIAGFYIALIAAKILVFAGFQRQDCSEWRNSSIIFNIWPFYTALFPSWFYHYIQ